VKVCGISVLTRKILVTRQFGADAWAQFFRDVAGEHRCFRSLVSADTLVPLPAYLAFHDELMRRFFKNDVDSYANLGRESCRWALTEGPLKALLKGESLGGVVASLPKFHRLYFEEASTWSEAALSGSSVEFKVFDLPEWHPYLEHFIVGYIAEVLEMYCANPIQTVRLTGGAGREYHYLFHGAPTAPDDEITRATGRARKLAVLEAARRLSNREVEVLLLVAQGKTNEEIGEDLGISKKTAQHHVAHAYQKIGVSGRVGAAVWLAERGLVGTDFGN
jgi:DNA-binding CsgD family transcriptional regulator